jgi:Fe-S oxidoreductase
MSQLIFVVLLAAAFGYFATTMMSMVRAAARGAADPRPRLDQLPMRLASVLIYFIGQKKVAEEGPMHMSSKHHLLIFWGFLLITVGTLELLIAGVWPSFSFDLLMPHQAYVGLRWIIDLFNLIVLMMVGWALFRRIVIQPRLIPMNLDAGLILGAIASLMVTHFLYHGFHIAAGEAIPGAPVSSAVAGWLAPIDPTVAGYAAQFALWIHVVILLAFLNYLPYSKHIHLLGALPNIFLRNLSERRLDMPKLDLEDENQWGVGKVEQFSWKSLVDNYACTECARCSNYCPAYNTEKNLSPMQLVHDIRYEMIDRDVLHTEIGRLHKQAATFPVTGGDDHHDKSPELVFVENRIASLEKELADLPPMVGGRIAEDTLWACTTCGACQEVCPVFIEHPLKILQMRQNLVLEQEKVPADLGRAFRNIERQSNPWGISNEKRMDWAAGVDVPTIEDNPAPEYILWVGCAGAFDNRIVKQTKALVKVLNAAGVNYAILGDAENCTGDPARRGGNEMLFQMMAEANIETLDEHSAKKVITSCPHCLHTLRHDYPQFGGDYEVIHHTQIIAHLLKEKKVTVEGGDIKSITYHDSCYLGRWNREFDAPRDVIEALNIKNGITELVRNKKHGFCCGAGGARMFMEEEGPRVNENRADEIIESGVEAVAVACPFCNIMITDGMKARNKEDDIQVLDIAELVAQAIPDVPVSSLVRHRDR